MPGTQLPLFPFSPHHFFLPTACSYAFLHLTKVLTHALFGKKNVSGDCCYRSGRF